MMCTYARGVAYRKYNILLLLPESGDDSLPEGTEDGIEGLELMLHLKKAKLYPKDTAQPQGRES